MTLHTAANGHLALEFDDSPDTLWEAALERLSAEAFRETGEPVLGPGQSIFPSYVRWSVLLLSGWDEWSGNYLLATCEDGDTFLEQLHARLAEGYRVK
jgi:hypothetical protein